MNEMKKLTLCDNFQLKTNKKVYKSTLEPEENAGAPVACIVLMIETMEDTHAESFEPL